MFLEKISQNIDILAKVHGHVFLWQLGILRFLETQDSGLESLRFQVSQLILQRESESFHYNPKSAALIFLLSWVIVHDGTTSRCHKRIASPLRCKQIKNVNEKILPTFLRFLGFLGKCCLCFLEFQISKDLQYQQGQKFFLPCTSVAPFIR